AFLALVETLSKDRFALFRLFAHLRRIAGCLRGEDSIGRQSCKKMVPTDRTAPIAPIGSLESLLYNTGTKNAQR
ncbi:hypothetical protein, partial [Porphyromonas loveana]|uniref:hypothetical protein n=1 Tax=Porphyromonas loveana TaxID=1884669 RepID=UPI0035A1C3A7